MENSLSQIKTSIKNFDNKVKEQEGRTSPDGGLVPVGGRRR
jgi:hypothetical protein